jgi:hypothetical protein
VDYAVSWTAVQLVFDLDVCALFAKERCYLSNMKIAITLCCVSRNIFNLPSVIEMKVRMIHVARW